MAQSNQPTLDEADTAVIRFWGDQAGETMGTMGRETEIAITVFNSERSLPVSQGRGQTPQGGGDKCKQISEYKENFLTVLGPERGRRWTAPRRPERAGKGITSLESRIRGADSPVELEPRPRAGDYL